MGLIVRSVGQNWALVLAGMLLAGMLMVVTTTVMFYMITAFTLTFGKTVLMMSDKQSFLVTLFVGISNLFWLPVMGALSDACWAAAAADYLYRVDDPDDRRCCTGWWDRRPSRTVEAELWLSFLYASYNGAMVVYLAEIMPAEVRASGFSLAYSPATALFGGFTPAISSYLIHATGDKAMPGVWLSFAAVCGRTLLIGRMVKQASGAAQRNSSGRVAVVRVRALDSP